MGKADLYKPPEILGDFGNNTSGSMYRFPNCLGFLIGGHSNKSVFIVQFI